MTSIRNLTAENAFGQPTTVVTGPLTRSYGYTTYGIPTMRKAQVSSTNVRQHFTYTFNTQTNNLTNRIDQTYNYEDFVAYDAINRKTSTGSGAFLHKIGYHKVFRVNLVCLQRCTEELEVCGVFQSLSSSSSLSCSSILSSSNVAWDIPNFISS
ncbi:MAG: hypothetical protein LBN06_04650 [Prevotellaceae bacterium]|nr:hypothetical protein [Prevotellaceae bacterium]